MLPAITGHLLLALAPQDPAHWPHWRGPEANGVARTAAPTAWSADENVRWKVELPGRGMSSPVIWDDKLFITTAVSTDTDEPEPPPEDSGDDRRGGRGGASPSEQSFEVHCLERSSGKTLWREVARVATPHEGYHRTYGSWASASPVTDGERLYVSFGSQGLYAYALDGKQLWSADPGTRLEMRNGFGEGLAPVLAGDALVQVFDHEGTDCILALDRKTGKELWRKSRDEPSTWATPLVTDAGGRLEVVTGGTNRVRSYSPANGELLWECGGLGLNAIPALLRSEDRVLAMSGFRNPRILAIRLGGKGDLTDSEAVVWSSTKGCAYTASPVLCDGLYYTVSDRGLVSCFDAESGEALYLEERLPRGSAVKSSPVAAGEVLYVPTEEGDVHLVRLGPEYQVAGTNSLPEQVFVASPAVAEGALYLRSLTHLFCIAAKGG